MFYIRTADKLMRTAPWLESLEGGIDKLRRIILNDELGICADLDAEMDALIGTYEDEWKRAVQDPDLRKHFRAFVNSEEKNQGIEQIVERGQPRAADWPRQFPEQKFELSMLKRPKEEWDWVVLATTGDLQPNDLNTT
jgi:nitrite reductase (NAD(P)H)